MGSPPETPGGDRLALEGIRAAASAPAKCILLGEHAVVYGEPCLSVALARRTHVTAHQVGDNFRVNGYPLTKRHHGFVVAALEAAFPDAEAIRFEVESDVPSASGLGSSAALTVATVAVLKRLRGERETGEIARVAFEAEHAAQGGGSPNDTSVAAAGGMVFLAPEESKEAGLTPLWSITTGDKTWFVHRAPVPRFGKGVEWVVGHTGVHAATRKQVEKVRRFVQKSGFAKDTIKSLGAFSWQGLDALRSEDPVAFGKVMDKAQDALVTLGVSHPSLDALVAAARRAPGTLGAKLTGAGGGGAMVVLSKRPERAVAALSGAGARVFRVPVTLEGVRPESFQEDEEAASEGAGTIEEASSGQGVSGGPAA